MDNTIPRGFGIQPTAIRLSKKLLNSGPVLCNQDIFHQRWDALVALESLTTVITLGRWRQDFDNQSWVKEIVLEPVFKLGFTARDHHIRVGGVRSLWDGDSHVAGIGPTPTTPQ